jgi:dihydroorotate dehydrogenase electron transfer subunit
MPAEHDSRLRAREDLGDGHVLLTFEHPEVAALAAPGQFVMIKAGLSADPPLRRPFSILGADPAAGTFSLFVKAVGAGSRSLCGLPVGGLARCLGPLGRPFARPEPGREALLVAGGYGIAPFRFLGEQLQRAGQPVRVFYGGRSGRDLKLRAPFEALGVPLVLASEDGSLGERGRVTVPLQAHLDDGPGPFALYACGPDAMLHAVARLALTRGLPCQVSLDPWMGCGIGTCLGCVVEVQRSGEPRPKRRCACTEGPVFEAREVVWPGERGSALGAA